MKINKIAYEKLIAEDIQWLKSYTEDTPERRHIVDVLNYSIKLIYGKSNSNPTDL